MRHIMNFMVEKVLDIQWPLLEEQRESNTVVVTTTKSAVVSDRTEPLITSLRYLALGLLFVTTMYQHLEASLILAMQKGTV